MSSKPNITLSFPHADNQRLFTVNVYRVEETDDASVYPVGTFLKKPDVATLRKRWKVKIVEAVPA